MSAGVRAGFSVARQDLSAFENRIERDQTFLPQQVHSQSDEQCEPAVEQPVQAAGVRARATFRCGPSSEYRITNHNSGEKAPVDGWNCSWHTPRGNVTPTRKADLSPLYSIILHTRADNSLRPHIATHPGKLLGDVFKIIICAAQCTSRQTSPAQRTQPYLTLPHTGSGTSSISRRNCP